MRWPRLMTTDLMGFSNQLATLAKTLAGEAALTPLEPELNVSF